MTIDYANIEPPRTEIDSMPGPVVIEFGVPWCPYCMRAQPLITAALGERPEVRHLKIEDGRGRRLGRSFEVKLWPTLIFMRDGTEVARLVRPAESRAVSEALARITSTRSTDA